MDILHMCVFDQKDWARPISDD